MFSCFNIIEISIRLVASWLGIYSIGTKSPFLYQNVWDFCFGFWKGVDNVHTYQGDNTLERCLVLSWGRHDTGTLWAKFTHSVTHRYRCSINLASKTFTDSSNSLHFTKYSTVLWLGVCACAIGAGFGYITAFNKIKLGLAWSLMS